MTVGRRNNGHLLLFCPAMEAVCPSGVVDGGADTPSSDADWRPEINKIKLTTFEGDTRLLVDINVDMKEWWYQV